MATVATNERELNYTGEAVELLDCFTGGFDKALSGLAEGIAISRAKSGVVSVKRDDIERAARLIVDAVNKSPNVDAEVKAVLNEMFSSHLSKSAR